MLTRTVADERRRYLDAGAAPGALAEVWRRVQGPGQITDAYLLALARHHGGWLARFDRRMQALATA